MIDDFSNVMSNLESSTQKAFDTIGGLGKAITGMSLAGAAGLGLAAKSAMNFEAQLSSIKAVTGSTNEEMAKISELATEMGEKTKYSSVEAAQGIEELLKAGVSLTDVLDGGLEGALSLAVAGELELAEAAEIASTALNAFKADGLSVTKASDLLAGAANASATSVGELKYGLSMVSAVASGVGMSFKDTSTALAVFANSGLRGSDAGTSLKTMLLNLSPSTEAASEMMGQLGLLTKQGTSAFYDAKGSIKSLAEISELLKTKLAKLSDEQRQMALKTMFGTDAIRAANILYKEGATGVETMFGAMSKVTAVDVMNERMNNTKGKIEELKGAAETMAISLGTALLPTISKLVVFVQSLVAKFNGLDQSTQGLIANIGLASVAFGLFVGPLLMIVPLIPSLTAGLAAIAGLLKITTSQLLIGAGVVAGAVLAIVALGVAFYLAYQKVDAFRVAVDGAWAWIKGAFKTSLDFIKGVVVSVMSSVSKFFGEQLGAIKKFWNDNGSSIMQLVKFYFTAVKANIEVAMAAIKSVFQTVWPIISGAVQIAWGVIKAVIAGSIQTILGIITVATKLLQGDWKGAWNAIKDTTKNIGSSIISYLKDIDLREIGRNIIQGLVNGISGMMGTVKEKIQEIASLIPKGIKDMLDINSPIKKTSAKTKKKAAALTMILAQNSTQKKPLNLKAVAFS
jgi:TP901 family phage tail tape measure protein